MKNLSWLLAALLACTPAWAQEEMPVEDDVPPAVAPGDFGYTMGYTMGARMAAELGRFDTDAYVEGFRAAQAGEPSRLTDDQMNDAIMDFQQRRMAELAEQQAQRAAQNAADGEAFLKKNGKRRGVKTTASGLQYEVLKKGKGASPKPEDVVTAHYSGTLPDGTAFDASEAGEPVTFALERVIRGWQEGLALMNKGAKFKLYIPAELAYGTRGAGDVIGPNQVLVFEVELVDFGPAPQPVPSGE